MEYFFVFYGNSGYANAYVLFLSCYSCLHFRLTLITFPFVTFWRIVIFCYVLEDRDFLLRFGGSWFFVTFWRIVISSGSKYWPFHVLFCLYLQLYAKPWRFGGSWCLCLQGQAKFGRFGGSCFLQGQSIDVSTSSCAVVFGDTQNLYVSEDRVAFIFRVKQQNCHCAWSRANYFFLL